MSEKQSDLNRVVMCGDAMNALKISYMVLSAICQLSFVALAVAAPIWITPGYYWWTAFGILMMFSASIGFTKRLNSWEQMGEVDI